VANSDWLPTTTEIRKEGVLVDGPRREFAARLPNQRQVAVAGRHVVQEDALAALPDAPDQRQLLLPVQRQLELPVASLAL